MSWPNLPPAYVTALQSQDVFAAPGAVISAIAGGGGPAPGPSAPTKAPTAPVVDGTPTETSIDILFDIADISGTAPIAFTCVYGTSSRPTTFLNAVQVSGNIWGATAPGLTAGTTYYFASRATNSAGYRESAVTAIATAGLSPVNQPPGVPIANAVTGTTITVSFTAEGVTGSAPFNFQVVYGQTPTPAVTIPAIYTGIGTLFFAQITGLTSGATYYIATRVSNSVNSRTSATISVTTGNGSSTPPGLVPSMNLSAASVSSIGVYFDVSSITGTQPITFSTLYGTTNPPQTPAIASLVSGTLYSTIINALPSSSTVYFDVQAGNAGGQTIGAVSAFSTLGPPIPPGGAPSAPGVPSVVSFTSTNNLTIANFDTAGQTGTSVSYKTFYGFGSNLPASALSTNVNATPSTGTIYTSQFGLYPGVYYTLASQALNGAGSTFSVSTTTYTAPVGNNGPLNVPNPTFVSATPSNITVAIDSAGVTGAQPISYFVRLSTDPTNFNGAATYGPGVLSTGTTQYILSTSKIATNQQFYFLSQASNAGGTYTQPAAYPTGPFSTLNGAPTNIPAPTLVSAGQSSLTLAINAAGIVGQGPYTFSPLVGTSPSTATTGYQSYSLSTGTIYTTTVDGPDLTPNTAFWVGTNVANALGNTQGPVGGPFTTASTLLNTPTVPGAQMLNSTSVTQVYINSADADIGAPVPAPTYAFRVFGDGLPSVFVPAVSLGGTSTLTATLPNPVPGKQMNVVNYAFQTVPGIGTVSTPSVVFYAYTANPPAPPASSTIDNIPYLPSTLASGPSSITTLCGAKAGLTGNGLGQFVTRWGPPQGPFTNSTVMTYPNGPAGIYAVMNGLAPSTNYLVQNIIQNPLSTIAGPSTILGTPGAQQVIPITPPAPLIYSISQSSLVFTVDGTGQPVGTVFTANLQPGGWIVPGVARPSTSFYDFTYSTTVQLQPNINYTTTATAFSFSPKTGPASLPSQINSAPAAPPSGVYAKLYVENPSTQIEAAFAAANIGSPTQVLLKYGLTPDYSSFSTVATLLGPINPNSYSALASGLTPGTSYTFAPYLSNPLSSVYTQTPIPLSTQG